MDNGTDLLVDFQKIITCSFRTTSVSWDIYPPRIEKPVTEEEDTKGEYIKSLSLVPKVKQMS